MDYVVFYEIVSIAILIIIYLFYLYRSWLDLRRNRTFYVLLITVILVTGVDLLGRMLIGQIEGNIQAYMMLISSVSNIGVLLVCAEFYTYFFALTKCQKQSFFVFRQILFAITAALVIGLLLNDRMHLFFWYNADRTYHITKGIYLLIVVAEIYLLIGLHMLLCNRHVLKRRHQWGVLVVSALIVMCLIPLQYLIPTKFRLTYYVLSCILSVNYLVTHMADQHVRQRGGSFSRVGMRQVVEERELYQKDFVCIAINITNISSILNVCTEDEMILFDIMIGKHLKSLSKQCVIYQSHSSEYILMCKDQKTAEINSRALREWMPRILRFNDQNVSVTYGFYMVSFADASFREGDFYRIIAGLRRLARNTTDEHTVIRYEGGIKEKLQQELQGIQRLNEVLETEKGSFDLEFTPIYSTIHGKVEELEAEGLLCLEDGHQVREQELWRLSDEKGNSKDMALRLWEEVINYATEQKVFEHGIRFLHINVAPIQISSKGMIDQLCKILEDKEILPQQIVVEVFVDQSVPEDILQENICYMHQRGFHMLLDQFGVNICNLKNILAMPFDQAKINVHMTKRLIKDKQDELQHLVYMLRQQGWKIYADGVDRLERKNELLEMGIDGIQGIHLASGLSEDQWMSWSGQKGGTDHEANAL